MNNTVKLVIGILVLAGLVLYSSAYVVDETEQVVLTQFGKVVGDPIKEPGLKFKIPFIQKTSFFEKVLLEWDGDQGQVPTRDKKYIWVDTFARWKIVDPVKFFQTVNNKTAALGRLDDIIDPAMRNLVTSYPLVESVRNSNRLLEVLESSEGTFEEQMLEQEDETEDKLAEDADAVKKETSFEKYKRYEVELGRDGITKRIVQQARPKLKKFGIELLDVKIKRVNYIDTVQEAVYERMIAERNQVAEKFRSEGRGQASEIRGEKEKILQEISSEAYETAETVKGEADAEATEIYASAYGLDPDFYSFMKTLDVYRGTLDKESTLVLSTDSDFMRLFKDGDVK